MSERPLAITVIGCFCILMGLLGFVGMFTSNGLKVEELLYGIISGIILLLLGIGCFKAWSWIWIVGIVYSVFIILMNIVKLFIKVESYEISGIIVFAIILYCMFQPQVKAYFGKT